MPNPDASSKPKVKGKKRFENFENVWQDLIGVIFGAILLLLLMTPNVLPPNEPLILSILTISLLLIGFCLTDLFLIINHHAPKNFLENKRAIGWQLTVFLAMIPCAVFTWYIGGWLSYEVTTVMAGFYTFSGIEAQAVQLTTQVIFWIVGLATLFGIIWLWVNSHRTDQ